MSRTRRSVTQNGPYMRFLGVLLALVGLAPLGGVAVSARAALFTSGHTAMNWAFAVIYLAIAVAVYVSAVECWIQAHELRQQRRANKQPAIWKKVATIVAWTIRFIKALVSISKSRRLVWFIIATALYGSLTLISYLSSDTTLGFEDYVAYLSWRQPLLVLGFTFIASVAAAIGLLALQARNQPDTTTTQEPADGISKQDAEPQA